MAFDLPAGDQAGPFSELRAFAEHLHAAEAAAATPVLAVGAKQDPSLLIVLRVDSTADKSTVPVRAVSLRRIAAARYGSQTFCSRIICFKDFLSAAIVFSVSLSMAEVRPASSTRTLRRCFIYRL
ncbi:hypothetical protein [Candidatus Protofrankia californiensis]|uniref:hypothetical protein n=1 Tax=Candidatus Protofrankia californiensis TaxID=1839754 RepID=UPI001041A3A8|nr:hypothetical protein [Candidatus Protofrankia californiensis]